MNTGVLHLVDPSHLGPEQRHEHVTVFPVIADATGPAYIALATALQRGEVTITEVSESGSVPTLQVTNTGSSMVLILDGEELVGARQNRVLNTSVLIAPEGKVVVPVSCVEQGRWRYEDRTFSDSDAVMARKGRAGKSRSVSENLRARQSFASDQGKVWEDVASMLHEVNAESPTGAMREAYTKIETPLTAWVSRFPVVPGQVGMVCFVGEKAIGLDIVSQPSVYGELHGKLLRSYLMEALAGGPSAGLSGPTMESAVGFLTGLTDLDESCYPSPGIGVDLRYAGPEVCGSALVCDDIGIHCAFFADDSHGVRTHHISEREHRIGSPSTRRRFRQNERN